MFRKSLLLVAILLIASTASATDTYTIDQSHSSVGFSVRHMAISKVRGHFGEFEGTLSLDPSDTTKWTCEATIQVASIDTDNEKRDDHLRSEDFFNALEFPIIVFKSTKVVPKGNGRFEIHGELTMHGVTKTVVLDAELLGATDDGYGNHRVGFSATVQIDRTDYGVSWSKALETGGLVVGHDVAITIDIEAIKKK